MADKIEEHMALVSRHVAKMEMGTTNEIAASRAAVEASARALAQGEPGEARLQQECDTITELNHAQWLALGKASLLVAACNRLSAEAEEFDFDDGLGRGAQQAFWDEFESALEHASEAIDEANKTAHRIHTTASAPAAPIDKSELKRLVSLVFGDDFQIVRAPAVEREPLCVNSKSPCEYQCRSCRAAELAAAQTTCVTIKGGPAE